MKKYLIIFICLWGGVGFSCSNWLDVKPSDRISEDNNFSSLVGFKKTLNGVYIELNSSDLYGKNLSCEFIEILAQRYAIGDENKSNKELMEFSYNGSAGRGKTTSIWGTAYKLIANTNLILKNIELHSDVLAGEYYNLIKGEALALRALLHFDLFRLFGPIYTEDSTAISIPYYKEFQFDAAPSYAANGFMNMVIEDLLQAEQLLVNDPIVKYGVKGNAKDVFLQDRNLRLNYYAVQGLLARAYLYMGNKERALYYAESVIKIQEEKFPWVTPMKLDNSKSADRVFSTEIMFALQNLNRNTLYTSLFDGANLKLNTLLAPRGDVVNYVFESDKADYRYSSSLSGTVEISGTTYRVFNKFQGTDSLYNQMIPMIRISEMYMIASETSTDGPTRAKYFNTFRNHRNLGECTRMGCKLLFRKRVEERVLWRGATIFLVQAQQKN
ncbi:MAG: RagB/SusD family nutrient uptake outer membrane protein [Odoribacter splanchnicus]